MNKETEHGSAVFGGKFPGSILQFVSHWPELSSKANLATSDWEMRFFFLVTLVNYFVTQKKGRMCIGGCYQPVLGAPIASISEMEETVLSYQTIESKGSSRVFGRIVGAQCAIIPLNVRLDSVFLPFTALKNLSQDAKPRRYLRKNNESWDHKNIMHIF